MSENNIKASFVVGETKVYIVPLDLEIQFFVYYSKKKICHVFINDEFFINGRGDPLLRGTYQFIQNRPKIPYIIGHNMLRHNLRKDY